VADACFLFHSLPDHTLADQLVTEKVTPEHRQIVPPHTHPLTQPSSRFSHTYWPIYFHPHSHRWKGSSYDGLCKQIWRDSLFIFLRTTSKRYDPP